MIKKYVKKPVIIEAIQWTGDNQRELEHWIGKGVYFDKAFLDVPAVAKVPCIATLEGYMEITLGDYIIKGVHGEFYPCKPDIFMETYEEVEG